MLNPLKRFLFRDDGGDGGGDGGGDPGTGDPGASGVGVGDVGTGQASPGSDIGNAISAIAADEGMMSVAPSDIGTGQAASGGGGGLFNMVISSLLGHLASSMGIPFGGTISGIANSVISGNPASASSAVTGAAMGMGLGPIGGIVGGMIGSAVGNMPGVAASSVASDPSGNGGLSGGATTPIGISAIAAQRPGISSMMSGYGAGPSSIPSTPTPYNPSDVRLSTLSQKTSQNPLAAFRAGFAVPFGMLMKNPYQVMGDSNG